MKVIIGGAGITGLAVSSYLQQKGIDFEIFEKSNESPYVSTGIQLASNCHFVFKELGIYDQIKEASIERKTLKVYSKSKFINELSVTNKNKEGTLFIRRADLLSILSSLIPLEKIKSSKQVSKISSINSGISLWANNCEVSADLFIDCMGANSKIANNSYITNSTAIWGISNFSNQSLKSFNNFMYEGMHLVTYPITRNDTAYTLVINNSKFPALIGKTITKEDVNKILKNQFRDLINHSKKNVIKPIRASNSNKWSKGNIIFLGDSAHSITPHLAQGAAQGLIDAAYLNIGFNKNIEPEIFFKKRNALIDRIRSESKLNKNRYQLGMPFNLLRNIYLKLYKPSYSWLFNSKYEA